MSIGAVKRKLYLTWTITYEEYVTSICYLLDWVRNGTRFELSRSCTSSEWRYEQFGHELIFWKYLEQNLFPITRINLVFYLSLCSTLVHQSADGVDTKYLTFSFSLARGFYSGKIKPSKHHSIRIPFVQQTPSIVVDFAPVLTSFHQINCENHLLFKHHDEWTTITQKSCK